MMSNLFAEIAKNVVFVLEFLAVVVVIFIAAKIVEKVEKKKTAREDDDKTPRPVLTV